MWRMPTPSSATIDDFSTDGFLVVRGAVAPDTVRACADVVANELRARGVDPHDPKTWSQPVVRLPCPEGPAFATVGDVTKELPASTFQRSRARATGRAGDVYVCHPFLVHRATWPHLGSGPRMVAQPAIAHHKPFVLRDGAAVCAVERAILRGLA